MQVTQRGTERVCFASPETDWRQLYSSVLTQSMTGDWRIQVDVSTDTVLWRAACRLDRHDSASISSTKADLQRHIKIMFFTGSENTWDLGKYPPDGQLLRVDSNGCKCALSVHF